MDLVPKKSRHWAIYEMRHQIDELRRQLTALTKIEERRRVTIKIGTGHVPGQELDWLAREEDETKASIERAKEMFKKAGVTSAVEFCRRQAGPYSIYGSDDH